MTDWLPTDETPLLEAAIAYASHGFRVLPVWGIRLIDGVATCTCGRAGCSTPGKHPIERAWQKKASDDADTVRDARRSRPHANIGLAMGGETRLVAIDIDGEKGRTSLRELEENVQPLPETLTSRSGRADGGEHRLFRVPPHLDIKRLGNRASFRLPGIDTRIDNGQIVVAPSVHASGARYTWVKRVPVAEMPEWLFEALAAPAELVRQPDRGSAPSQPPPRADSQSSTPYVRKVVSNAAARIAAAPQGMRNQLLYAKACTTFEYLIGAGIDHLAAWRDLSASGLEAGLPEREVSDVLSNAWRKVQGGSGRRVPERPPPEPSSPPAAPPPVAAPSQPEPEDPNRWKADLVYTGEGGIKNTFGNVCKIIRHAPGFRGRLSFNQMRVVPCVDGRTLADVDLARFREDIEATFGVAPSHETVMRALALVAAERAFHPVQQYLSGLTWDGQSRIERVAAEIFGQAQPDALTLRMLRCWFISAVARALSPGCKVDSTLVLVGNQGYRKSTFFATLGGEWFSDSYVDIRSKDGVLQVHAAWIYEWAEIDHVTTRTSASAVKAFLTVARDDVRPPYGIGVVSQPRSSVIVGTTNKPFLDDETGSRRFHPVNVERVVDVETLRAWRDQLWAEAVSAFRAGEDWWLSAEDERQREVVAHDHIVEDPWLPKIAAFLQRPSVQQSGVTTSEIISDALNGDISRIDRAAETRVGKTLQKLGWEAQRVRRHGARIRVYWPSERAGGWPRLAQVGTIFDNNINGVPTGTTVPTYFKLYRNENKMVSPPFKEGGGRVGPVGTPPPPPVTPEGEELFADWLDDLA